MQKEEKTLQEIKGVGDKLSEKILKHVGGEENLKKIVKNLDIEQIANIEGISQRKAIEIMNQLLDKPTDEFIKSERAYQLYEDIIEKILSYSNTKYSKNRILLLSPSKNKESIESQIEFVINAKNTVSQLPLIKLKGLMANLEEIKKTKPDYDPSKAILVESEEDNAHLTELGFHQYYPIITASDSPLLQDELMNYELIFYVYSQGVLDFGDLPNLIMIHIEEEEYEIVPEKIINFFMKNKNLF
jgi:ribosomal protein S13